MVNGITWEEGTLAKIEEARKKQKEAQNLIKQGQEDEKFWGEYADTLERGMKLDKERNKIHPNGYQSRMPEHFQQQSTWNNLLDIMKDNNGFLVVTDAVTILVNAKVFSDREHARNVIYSTLYAHKHHVSKIRGGVYQLKKEVIHKATNTKKKSHKKRVKNDIVRIVEQLKNHNQQLTKNEVMNHLINMGFDFKGKNPSKSLSMAWVKLGYHREGKQQPLPEVS